MAENSFEAQYDLTKKSKLKVFYESNKILIFTFFLIIIISIVSLNLYFKKNELEKIALSEKYIQAKILLGNGNKNEATNILKEIVFENDTTYSALCFFLIVNQNLIIDDNELIILFDHILKNNKFEDEIRNLIIFKKVLLSSNYLKESEIINELKPLLNSESLWKPHALLLLGKYFVSRNEYSKAKEFYSQILSIKNLEKDMYDQAISQLSIIAND
jgi:predicted negative regulator of RcsB-dependent stress response